MEQYGHDLKKKCFLLRDDLINFNHGSFGAVPKTVMEELINLLREVESFPDLWFRDTMYKLEDRSRELVAELIKADKEDVVMVENASYAINSVLRSFPFKQGDKVLVFSSAYRMVTDTLRFLQMHQKVETVVVDIPYPLTSAQQMVDAVSQMLADVGEVRMCIFSHISSMPTIIEPIEQLTPLARAHGSIVIIDGAHAPGILDIDVESIGADIYTGNLHKWLFTPKGCAFLHVSKKFRDSYTYTPQPVVISSTGRYDYVGRFAYTGTRDYTAFAALPVSLTFVQQQLGGMGSMRAYCRDLLAKGCELCVREWKTGYLVPLELQGVMANVLLPCSTQQEADALQTHLIDRHSTYIVTNTVYSESQAKNVVFIRISAQVYLDLGDFEKLAKLVKEFFKVE
eukprot:gene38784-47163_t